MGPSDPPGKRVAAGIDDLPILGRVMSAISVTSDWLTSSEVADRLGVSERTVQRYVHRGVLRAHRLAPFARLRFREEDVERLLEQAGAAA